MSPEDLQWMTSGQAQVVHLAWTCRLTGRLSSNDRYLLSPVTWGQLLGCPDDPWQYSRKFLVAMQEMEVPGRDKHGDCCRAMGAAQWSVQHKALLVDGNQKVEERKGGHLTWFEFCGHLGKLFSAIVPTVACVNAVDCTPQLEMWSQHCPETLLTDNIRITRTNVTHPGAREMIAAIMDTDIVTLRLDINEGLLSDFDTECPGFLLNTLICGRSLRGPPSGLGLVRSKEYELLELDFCEAPTNIRPIEAVFSAVSKMKLVKKLCIGIDEDAEARDLWMWLAFAVFSDSSTCSAREITIRQIPIKEYHVSAVKSVVECGYPLDLTGLIGRTACGCIDVPEGKELKEVRGDVRFVTPRSFRARAVYDYYAPGIHVVVPGCGICRMMERGDAFVHDTPDVRDTRRLNVGIQSLRLEFVEAENGTVLTNMLALIGGGLTSLFISNSFGIREHNGESPEIDLAELAKACPLLTTLRLKDLNVTVSDHDRLRNWSLRSLIIVGADEAPDLDPCLAVPTCRLVEFKVAPMYTNDETMEELNAHNGEFLPLTKAKFPLNSKAAMISVVWNSGGSDQSIGPINRLDARILSLVFGFAAIPEQRTVQVLEEKDEAYLN